MTNNILEELQKWYHVQCNGRWEYTHGIRIETTSQPGWVVYVSIHETNLQFRPFTEISIKRNEGDWIDCNVNNGFFVAHCSVFNLSEVLELFQKWNNKIVKSEFNQNLAWLIQWFQEKCDGSWEQNYGIRLTTIDNPGWVLNISLQKTECATQPFEKIIIERSDNNWIHISKQHMTFTSACGPLNLLEVLQIFCHWAQTKESQQLNIEKQKNDYWKIVKRFDGIGGTPHWNRILKMDIPTPHVHDSSCPGGTRPAETWEIPK